jgi:hypothetical protein
MGKPKVEAILKQTNRFAVLAEDSDDDLPDYVPLSPNFGSTPADFPPEAVAEPQEPAFRVWKNDVTRFSSDTNNIFSSPFSRKRNTKKEEDGWTSIESGPAMHSALGPLEQRPAPSTILDGSQEFPSMLQRGDVADALAWAEKVKNSLEKARTGQRRNLSFFRRTVVLDEKF